MEASSLKCYASISEKKELITAWSSSFNKNPGREISIWELRTFRIFPSALWADQEKSITASKTRLHRAVLYFLSRAAPWFTSEVTAVHLTLVHLYSLTRQSCWAGRQIAAKTTGLIWPRLFWIPVRSDRAMATFISAKQHLRAKTSPSRCRRAGLSSSKATRQSLETLLWNVWLLCSAAIRTFRAGKLLENECKKGGRVRPLAVMKLSQWAAV